MMAMTTSSSSSVNPASNLKRVRMHRAEMVFIPHGTPDERYGCCRTDAHHWRGPITPDTQRQRDRGVECSDLVRGVEEFQSQDTTVLIVDFYADAGADRTTAPCCFVEPRAVQIIRRTGKENPADGKGLWTVP